VIEEVMKLYDIDSPGKAINFIIQSWAVSTGSSVRKPRESF